MGHFSGRKSLHVAVGLAALAMGALAPAAMAADLTYTWSGGNPLGSGSATYWSQSANWNGTAPAPLSAGSYVFPALDGTSCPSPGAADACYQGYDDFTTDNVNFDGLTFTGSGYDIGGTNVIGMTGYPAPALGSGGITEIGNLRNTFGIPFVPNTDQTWTLTGTGPSDSAFLDLGGTIGPGSPVTVDATNGATLELAGADDEFPLAFDGSGPSSGLLKINANFNIVHGAPISVQNATVEFGDEDISGLTATGSNVVIGIPGPVNGGVTAELSGLTATSSTATFEIDGTATGSTMTAGHLVVAGAAGLTLTGTGNTLALQ
jgi:hypothetical protein